MPQTTADNLSLSEKATIYASHYNPTTPYLIAKQRYTVAYVINTFIAMSTTLVNIVVCLVTFRLIPTLRRRIANYVQ